MRKSKWIFMTSLLVPFFQNCTGGFAVTSDQLTSSSQSSGAASDSEDEVSPVQLVSTDKAIGDATTTKTLSWDLSQEVTKGKAQSVQFQVSIVKYIPPDGSADTYFVTNPTITTHSDAIQLKNLSLHFNGELDALATTFTGLDLVIQPNQTVVLSTATLLHQLSGPAKASDTIALDFDVLWQDGIPYPDSTSPGTQVNGATLYANYCAGCHGALAQTTKPNRTAAQISASLTSVSQMTFLQGQLSQSEIQAIALTLGQ